MSIIFISTLILGALFYFKKPTHNKNWRPEQGKLPIANIDGDNILIKNIRNSVYRSENNFKLAYYDKIFDLGKLNTIDFVIQPFTKMPLIGHLLFSFGFEDGEYISISIEARRKKGKEFSLFWGFFRKYELIYIIADEADMLRLRPLHHKDNVYVYPLNIKKEKIRNIFLDILKRVNKIDEKSEFYNSITNSCVSNLFTHIRKAGLIKIPRSWRFFFPGNLDKLVYDLKLIKTDLPFDNLREKHLINKKADKYKNHSDYSKKIREK